MGIIFTFVGGAVILTLVGLGLRALGNMLTKNEDVKQTKELKTTEESN